MLPPGASEASSSESSRYYHSYSLVLLVAFRLSFFFSEEFLDETASLCFVSDLSIFFSLSISLRVCVCKAETNN